MSDNAETAINESTWSFGGWFGDVVDGLKQPTIDALGFGIRNAAGFYDTSQPMPVNPIAVNPTVQQPQMDNGDISVNPDLLLFGGLGLLALFVLND